MTDDFPNELKSIWILQHFKGFGVKGKNSVIFTENEL